MKLITLVLFNILLTASLQAQSQFVPTQERFQDLFATAGYGTAFGAALGAAVLPFQSNPEKNLRLVAIGASIGFIGGSILGSYVVFSPSFSSEILPAPHLPQSYSFGPILDDNSSQLLGIQGSIRIAKF